MPDASKSFPAPAGANAPVTDLSGVLPGDVGDLVDDSRPTPSPVVGALPILSLLALAGAVGFAAFASPEVGLPAGLLLLGVSLSATIAIARLASAAKDERRRVQEAAELTRLRQWPEAGRAVGSLLARPMRLASHRVRALALAVKVLARSGRHDDAAELAGELADEPGLDPATKFDATCGLAMLQLRTGRLGEANDTLDRLRSEVRRIKAGVRKARQAREAQSETQEADDPEPDAPADVLLDAAGEDVPPPPSPLDGPADASDVEPGPLVLAEIYRDVQTNHATEAVELFDQHRDVLRRSLGMRFGDALALAAAGAEAAGLPDRARGLWHDAPHLQSAGELVRIYPELARLAGRYEAAGLDWNGGGA